MSNWIKDLIKKLNNKGGFFMFMRAGFSSQISGLTDFVVSAICVNIFGIYYGFATFLGNVVGGLLNCFINYRWTFKSDGTLKIRDVLIKFVLVWIGSIFLNSYGTIFFTEYVMQYIPLELLPNIISKNVFLLPKLVVSIIVGFVWNYNMQRLFVYKDRDYRRYLRKLKIKNKFLKRGKTSSKKGIK